MLKTQPISSIRPFDNIACPVCGGHAFTELVHGGVWCDECNAEFKVRHTGGDAGCVVDCHVDQLHSGYERVLIKRGLLIKAEHYPFGYVPGVYFYKVMKSPNDDGTSGEESSWILSSVAARPDRMLYADKEKRRPIWEYQHKPLITKEEERAAVAERNAKIRYVPTSA